MDIDIDISPKVDPTKIFNVVRASMIEDNILKKHNVGVYFQNMPSDPITGLAAIPYKEAESQGFFKIDMLPLHILNNFESKEELRAILRRKPNWKLLEEREIVERLFHIGKHFDIVYQIKPTSVLELADIMALIRPEKINLLNKYIRNKVATRKELYTKRLASDLRKSHAIAYSLMIVVNLNLIDLGLL